MAAKSGRTMTEAEARRLREQAARRAPTSNPNTSRPRSVSGTGSSYGASRAPRRVTH